MLNSINLSEAMRYLGYTKDSQPTEEVKNLVAELACDVLAVQDLRVCYDVFDISIEGSMLDLGFAKVNSNSLAKNLSGCKKIILFACTAGAGIDRMLVKCSRLAPSKYAVVQALGAALAEDWCDDICARLSKEYGKLKPRFSCGYGDLDLSLQRDIFTALSVTKNIGITLSDNLFMTPTKSVTAIVGIVEN